jgi:hypothetical protein
MHLSRHEIGYSLHPIFALLPIVNMIINCIKTIDARKRGRKGELLA